MNRIPIFRSPVQVNSSIFSKRLVHLFRPVCVLPLYRRFSTAAAAPGSTALPNNASTSAMPADGTTKLSQRMRRQRQARLQRVSSGAPARVRHRVTSYCIAKELQLDDLMRHLTRRGLAPQLLVEDTIFTAQLGHDGQRLEVFYMESGSVVIWGADGREEDELVLADTVPFASGLLASREYEDMAYVEVAEPSKVGLFGGLLAVFESPHHGGAGSGSAGASGGGAVSSVSDDDDSGEGAQLLRRSDKLTCSYALAKSAQLEVLEKRMDDLLDATRDVPSTLAGIRRSDMRRINKNIARLLTLRADLNLHSQLLDAPELAWDSEKLAGLYHRLTRHLEIDVRAERINRRLDYSKETFDLLRQAAAEKHSSFLENIIIYLIAAELISNLFPISKWMQTYLLPWLQSIFG